MDYPRSYQEFCNLFTKHAPEASVVGDRYYLESEELKNFKTGEQRKPHAKGLPLGMASSQAGFVPTSALLGILALNSEVKATLPDEKTEWLFVCGRDIFAGGFRSERTRGLVLVQNHRDENLGLGELIPSERGVMLRNILDLGNYLRHGKVQLTPKRLSKQYLKSSSRRR